MKKIKLILLLVITFNSFAQDVTLVKSEIFKDSKKNSSLEYSLEDGNGGLVTIRAFYKGMIGKLKGYYIQHFDAELKLKNEVELEVDNNLIKNAFIKDNRLNIVEYVNDRKSKKIVFNALVAELSDLQFSRNQILSFSEDEQQKYFGVLIGPVLINNFSQIDGNHSGEVVMSKNKNFFAINFDINNKEKETHKIFVYNNNFEKIYDQKIQKNIKDKYFEYNDIVVDDNDGTVYFLGKSYENNTKKAKKNGVANYHFELYKATKKGQSHTTFKYADKFISSLELVIHSNHISSVGFYGDNKESKVNGVCFFDLDTDTLKIEHEKFTVFSEKFLTDKYGDSEKKKNKKAKKGIKNIDFKSIHIATNGDIIINAEEFYITTRSYMDSNGNFSTTTVYHFDDIIAIRLDENGNLKWARNINKSQTGFSNSSYTSIPVGEASYFFINCSDNLKKLSNDRILFKNTKADKSNLYAIKINKEGQIDFKKIIDDKESKVYYKVNNGNIDQKNQTVILIGKKKKNTRILKINI